MSRVLWMVRTAGRLAKYSAELPDRRISLYLFLKTRVQQDLVARFAGPGIVGMLYFAQVGNLDTATARAYIPCHAS
jgi:hypothetical protein